MGIHLLRSLDEPARPRFEFRQRDPVRFESRVALPQQSEVFTLGSEILWFHVKRAPIQPLSANARPPEDQIGNVRQHDLERNQPGGLGESALR